MITIVVNKEQTKVPLNISVDQLLTQLEIVKQGIAVAINESIVPRSTWETTVLFPDDDLLIIKATQGG